MRLRLLVPTLASEGSELVLDGCAFGADRRDVVGDDLPVPWMVAAAV
jgi:hypothetical protein